jgi:hypothetical protein
MTNEPAERLREWPVPRPDYVPDDDKRCGWFAGRCEWPVHGPEHTHYTEYRSGIWVEALVAERRATVERIRPLLETIRDNSSDKASRNVAATALAILDAEAQR